MKCVSLTRNRTFGVGKTVREWVYLHRSYERLLPARVQAVKIYLPKTFAYTVVKYNTQIGAVGFAESPDFDTADEPSVGLSIMVSADNIVSYQRPQNKIYHHKWAFVADDYPRFNVARAKARSRAWLSLPKINLLRIGDRTYWENEVVPQLRRLSKDGGIK